MNLKEFFKLSWSKFILFLIIATFSTAVLIVLREFSGSILVIVFFPFEKVLGYLFMPVAAGTSMGAIALGWNIIVTSIARFLDLFFQYFISCLIIFVINQIKK